PGRRGESGGGDEEGATGQAGHGVLRRRGGTCRAVVMTPPPAVPGAVRNSRRDGQPPQGRGEMRDPPRRRAAWGRRGGRGAAAGRVGGVNRGGLSCRWRTSSPGCTA